MYFEYTQITEGKFNAIMLIPDIEKKALTRVGFIIAV